MLINIEVVGNYKHRSDIKTTTPTLQEEQQKHPDPQNPYPLNRACSHFKNSLVKKSIHHDWVSSNFKKQLTLV